MDIFSFHLSPIFLLNFSYVALKYICYVQKPLMLHLHPLLLLHLHPISVDKSSSHFYCIADFWLRLRPFIFALTSDAYTLSPNAGWHSWRKRTTRSRRTAAPSIISKAPTLRCSSSTQAKECIWSCRTGASTSIRMRRPTQPSRASSSSSFRDGSCKAPQGSTGNSIHASTYIPSQASLSSKFMIRTKWNT